jgi:glycine cleavage system P protein (glycine dehydrogenase) subunit 1
LDFLPHTTEDDRAMLEAVGAADMSALFSPIPEGLLLGRALETPPPLSEVELAEHLGELSRRSQGASELRCFAGGGSYDHHVPAAVRALASRSEFSTSYTPYQPELSQGVLQAIFEFQTLICELYAMEVANASLYDGASALTEAVNLAVRVKGRERVVVGGTVHPNYLEVLKTYTSGLGIGIDVIPPGPGGTVAWESVDSSGAAAVVVASPNFFGLIEDVPAAASVGSAAGALSIAVSDPTAMGVLAPPGDEGADVAVGEGMALGNGLNYGGPAVGLFATRLEHVRQVPGRIAGETLDADDRRAYVLTLQAREQHIRRAKATSNVCTNQTLMAIAASVYLSWLGPVGLRRLGEICVRRTAAAARRLEEIPGCRLRFPGTHFKEIVLETPMGAAELSRGLARRGYLAGPPLSRWFEGMDDCLLIAVTERRTREDISGLAVAIEKELAER